MAKWTDRWISVTAVTVVREGAQKSLSHLGDQGAGFANVKELWKPQPSFPNEPYRQSHDVNIYSSNPTPAVRTYTCPPPPPLLLFSGQPSPSPLSPLPGRSLPLLWIRSGRGGFRHVRILRPGLGWAALRVETHSRNRGGGKSRRRRGTVRESAMVVKKQLLGQVEAAILAKFLQRDFLFKV